MTQHRRKNMWARVESDTVTKIYTRPKALSIGDVNYPAIYLVCGLQLN